MHQRDIQRCLAFASLYIDLKTTSVSHSQDSHRKDHWLRLARPRALVVTVNNKKKIEKTKKKEKYFYKLEYPKASDHVTPNPMTWTLTYERKYYFRTWTWAREKVTDKKILEQNLTAKKFLFDAFSSSLFRPKQTQACTQEASFRILASLPVSPYFSTEITDVYHRKYLLQCCLA